MISLSKGQKLSLKKEGNNLKKIEVGVGWGKREIYSKGFFGIGAGTRYVDVDLDASVIMYDGNRSVVDKISFRQLKSRDGSIVHSGDDLVGGGTDNDPNETIHVNLEAVPGHVQSIIFVVNSYSGEDFGGIPTAFCNIVNSADGSEFARYNLSVDGGATKGFVLAKIFRSGSSWEVEAIGKTAQGRQRTVDDIEPTAREFA